MDLYRQEILDHYKYPRNFGHLDKPDVEIEDRNISCGDRIKMEIKIKVDSLRSKIIDDIRFSGEGCAISQASASMLTQKVKKMSAGKIMKLTTEDILKMLEVDLTPTRVKCALLPLEVIQRAVAQVIK